MTVPALALVPLAGAVVLLAIARPSWALVLPLVFHAAYRIRSTIPLGELAIPTTLLEVFVGVLVVTASVRACTRVQGREQYRAALRSLPRGAIILVLLFLLAATASAAVALHPRTSWGQWKAFIVEPLLYALVLLPLLREPSGRLLVARSLLWGGAVSAGFSLVAGLAGLVFLPRAEHGPWTTDFLRLRGVYDVPNSLALVLTPLIVFAMSLARSGTPAGTRRLARWALLLTQSLGGLLAVVVVVLGGVGGVLRYRSKNLLQYTEVDYREGPGLRARRFSGVRSVAAALLLAVVVLGLGLQFASGKLPHALAEHSPLAARRQIWAVSLQLLRDHPLVGTGLGTFEPAYQAKLHEGMARGAWPDPVLEWVVRDPHNLVLSLWLQTGLLGLVAMAALVGTALSRRTAKAGEPAAFSHAARGALVALLVFGLVDVPYFKNDLSLLWWALLAILHR